MNPMEYGERVQDALRVLIDERLGERESPVRSRAALSKALGHGEARQYVASRFAPQGKAGALRDLTVPDLVSFAAAIGLEAHDLLRRAQERVDLSLVEVVDEGGIIDLTPQSRVGDK